MEIEIRKVVTEDKLVLAKLFQFYAYDFSEFVAMDLNPHGEYTFNKLDSYFVAENRIPFFLTVEQKITGFVLVDRETVAGSAISSIAEFFIMRKYRQRQMGKTVAGMVFRMFPGRWQVSVRDYNPPALAFWAKVIDQYTGSNFELIQRENWDGPTYQFEQGFV